MLYEPSDLVGGEHFIDLGDGSLRAFIIDAFFISPSVLFSIFIVTFSFLLPFFYRLSYLQTLLQN